MNPHGILPESKETPAAAAAAPACHGAAIRGDGESLDALARAVMFQEDERRFLALEIHDVISQALASLFYRAQICEFLVARDPAKVRDELAEIRHLAQGLLDEITVLVFNLRPPTLDEGALTAIRRYTVEYRRQVGLVVNTSFKGEQHHLAELSSLFLYRLVQESLTNVRRHAQACAVWVEVEVQDGGATGRIRDDGIGFEPAALGTRRDRPHQGILGMQERAGLLGGSLTVESAPGQGTTVSFFLPNREDFRVAPALAQENANG